jgi:hypothetical protein
MPAAGGVMADEKRVVEFKPKPKDATPEYPATVKPRNYSTDCQHEGQKTLDESARTITCDGCKAVLDPIAVVARWAHKWDRQRWAFRQEKELDRSVDAWLERGGRITIRPSGVVVEYEGRRWASSCSGGMSDQLRSALQRAAWDIERGKQPTIPKP